MGRVFSLLTLVGLLLLSASGCIQIDNDKPLVDLGSGSQHRAKRVDDPAPGTPRDQLSSKDQFQRDLADCQQSLDIQERKYDKLKQERKRDKERREDRIESLKDQIEELEDQIEDLQKENHKLRKRR